MITTHTQTLREMLSYGSKLPWRLGGPFATILTDEAEGSSFTQPDDVEAYGGYMVGESMQKADREKIVAVMNAAPAILDLLDALDSKNDVYFNHEQVSTALRSIQGALREALEQRS